MEIKIKNILCPTDFSDNSEHALCYAIALAQTHAAQLHLLHVVEPPVYPISTDYFGPQFEPLELLKELDKIAAKQLEATIERVKTEHDAVDGKLVAGSAFLEIIHVAREDNIDLIVIGTHGRTGLAHVMIGSVAEKIVRKAPCPVLTVKHPEHEFVMP